MAHADDVDISGRVRRWLTISAAGLALLTVGAMVLLRPTGRDRPDVEALGVTSRLYEAGVVGVDTMACSGTRESDHIPCDVVTAELHAGPDEGREVELEFPLTETSPRLERGDDVVLSYQPGAPAGSEYQFADRQRRPALLGLVLAFALVVVVLGRLRGAAALAGLVATLVVLLQFALPAIIDGRSPFLVAVVASSVIAYFALYLAHGFSPMTTVALLGTLGSLALTAVLASVFVGLSHFSGFGSEEAIFLQVAGGTIDLRGLLLAGVVIGALGAIDDMTVTQASAVWELRAADPAMPTRSLYAAGLRIGRDHVASTVNTLLLAYAGASMPLMLLFVLSGQSLGTVANGEVVATEIVRTLVGSIGLVAAVPLTTWLASVAVPPARRA